MPLYPSHSLRYAFRASIFVAAVAIFSLFSPVAHADPHAVFYTDRGQEQVFFNVLAALNQADFVEPGTGQYSREKLVTDRASAPGGFVPEPNQVVAKTKTDLPGVVSRSITLEGHDLWTAFLVNQFAIEVATRRSVSELERLFCERGLGRIGCSPIPGNAQQQDKAFVTRPITREGERDVAINAALASGTQSEKNIRQDIEENQDIATGAGASQEIIAKGSLLHRTQRPDDSALAGLRSTITGNESANRLVDSLAFSVMNLSSGVQPEMFDGVTFSGDVKQLPDVASNSTTAQYTDKLEQLAALPSAMLETARQAEETVSEFQYYQDNPTATADYVLETNTSGGQAGQGSLLGRITTPSSAKLAAVNELAALAANTATSQTYTNPRTIAQAGDRSLVEPGKKPLTLGATTDSNGQVAGIATGFDKELYKIYKETYDGPQSSTLSPSVHDESVLLEPGTFDALSAFTDDTYRKGDLDNPLTSKSAFSMKVDTFLASKNVKDILCSLFPSANSCLAQG